jgi:hypothetical protein
MSSLSISLISVACIFAGAMLGMWVRRWLPEHHLKDESRETIKVGSGMIATLAALVLGLLVGSSKGSFDSTNTLITQAAAKMLVLDGVLANYGPDTKAAREHLRRTAVSGVEMFWPAEKGTPSGMTAFERANAMETMRAQLRNLTPATDAQRQLLAEAQSITGDLLQMRWLLVEQAQGSLPSLLVIILLFWLAVLHFSFGLLAHRNVTTVVVLLISSISMSGAIFLILEMNHPLNGFVRVPPTPMLKAIELMHSQKL